MIYNKIIEALDNLNIELAFQEYLGENKEYILFDIYLEEDTNYADNKATEVRYSITLSYYHKSKAGIKKYKLIKESMKENGFFFNTSKSLKKENDLFGKNFDFIYIENIEE